MKYRLLVDFEAVNFVLKLPYSRQRRLYAHFSEIQMFPGNFSDFVEKEDKGRTLHVSIFDAFQIKYWIDDADRHVKILQIVKNE